MGGVGPRGRWRAAAVFGSLVLASWRTAGATVRRPFPVAHNDTYDPDYSINRRGDWCDLARLGVDNLGGRDLNIVFRANNMGMNMFPFVEYQEGTDLISGGFFIDLLDEMAGEDLGHFKWRLSFAAPSPPTSGKDEVSVHDFTLWAVDHYDLLVDWLTMTEGRTEMGLDFLVPILDTGLHIIAPAHDEDPPWYKVMFAFLSPFSFFVWGALALLLVMSAWAYRLLEKGQTDFQEIQHGEICHSMYLTAVTFTGGGGFTPSTGPGKFFSFMFTFMMLLVVSAYTANLASMLTVHGTSATAVRSLTDAAARRLPVCNAYDFIYRDILKDYAGLNVVHTHSIEETYEKIRSGECKAGTVRHFLWQVAKNKKAYNPDCNLKQVGSEIHSYQSGFVTKAITRNDDPLCRGFVAKIINTVLLKLYNSGKLDKLRERYLRKAWDHQCPAEMAISMEAEGTMEMKNFHGIFGIYLLAMVGTLVWHRCAGRKRGGKASSTSDQSESGESEEDPLSSR